jgi:hypothetical protein
MTEVFSSGEWKAKDGEEQEFESAWTEFARWASEFSPAEYELVAKIEKGAAAQV